VQLNIVNEVAALERLTIAQLRQRLDCNSAIRVCKSAMVVCNCPM
jgi:hypothetical protein